MKVVNEEKKAKKNRKICNKKIFSSAKLIEKKREQATQRHKKHISR